MLNFVWLVLALVLSVSPAVADTRVALIVANATYQTAPLSNPAVDAGLVKTALDSIGFTTTVVENAKIDEFETALHNFTERARGAEVALFYYAGHGFAVSDRGGPRNFLMGVDADVTTASERALRAYGLPLDDVVRSISENVSTTLIFIDACRNDPSISRAVGGRGRGAVPVDRAVGENVLVGLSTRLGEVAADGEPGEGSPFARAFAANITKAGIRVDDAFTQARLAVAQETNQQQRPDIGRYDLENPLVLVPAASGEPTEVGSVQYEELAAYSQATAVGSCGAFKAFVRRYPESFYAELAHERAKAACSNAASPSSPMPVGSEPIQRLASDGNETESGTGSASGQISSASKTEPSGKLVNLEVALADPNETPPASGTARATKAIFYEERTTESDGSAEPGSVVWSLVEESPGANLPPEPAVRAEVSFPGKDVRLRMTIKRNADKSLPASHLIEMIFFTPDGFSGGGVDNILRIAMKGSEQEAGQPLIGVPAKAADGFFLVALNDTKAEIDANLALLGGSDWMDIPVVYKSGRRALVTIEKGVPGATMFERILSRGKVAPDSVVKLKPSVDANSPPIKPPAPMKADGFWELLNGQ